MVQLVDDPSVLVDDTSVLVDGNEVETSPQQFVGRRIEPKKKIPKLSNRKKDVEAMALILQEYRD